MNKTLIMILFLLISSNIFAVGENCSPALRDTYFWYDGKTIPKIVPGNDRELSEAWKIKCAPIINKIAENEEAVGSSMTCEQCFAKYFGRDRYRLCTNGPPCESGSGSANLIISYLNYAKAVVAECPRETFCNASESRCEYTCPAGFSYNIRSGYCEKSCPDNNIVDGRECVPCGPNEIANKEDNICVACEEGKIIQNGECVDLCPIEGQEFTNGECSCKEGFEVVDFACKAVTQNPCPFPEVPYGFNNTCLRTVDRTTTMLSPSLNSNNFRTEMTTMSASSNYSGSAQFIGCIKSQGQQKALLRIETNSYDVENINSYRVYHYCVDGSASSPETAIPIGYYPAMIGTSNYITVSGVNSCYKHRFVTFNGFTRGDIATVNIPYETCNDCTEGLVKINGECRCPVGQNLVDGVCQSSIVCKTAADFASGKCVCPGGLAYRRPGFNLPEYTCSPPPYNWTELTTWDSSQKVSITANRESCQNVVAGSFNSNRITYSYTVSNPETYEVQLGVICIGGTYNKPTLQAAQMTPSTVGGITTVFPGQTKSGTFTIDADGTCYKYALAARYFFGWVGSQEINIEYPTLSCVRP